MIGVIAASGRYIREQAPQFEILVPVTAGTGTSRFVFSATDSGGSISLVDYNIDWGDGTVENLTDGDKQNGAFVHTYSTSFTGNIKVTISNDETGVISLGDNTLSGGFSALKLTGDTSYYSQFTNLKSLILRNSDTSGDINNLPITLEEFTIRGNNTITGDISTLINHDFRGDIEIGGQNTIFGDITNVFNQSNRLTIEGNNSVSGVLDNKTATNINIKGANTISGLIQNLHDGLSIIRLEGNTTIGGNLELTSFTNISNIVIRGENIITGNLEINGVPDSFTLEGNNTVSGRIHLIGQIGGIFTVFGQNTLSGDYNLVDVIPGSHRITGQNTITGLFDGLGRIFFTSIIPSPLNNGGFSGNLANLDLNALTGTDRLPLLSVQLNGVMTYSGRSWDTPDPNGFFALTIVTQNSSYALTSTELDQLLIDLNNSTFPRAIGVSKSSLNLSGGFSRTSASDTAFNQLITDGMIINIS